MFIFGHLGITFGIFFLAGLIVPSIRRHFDYRFIALGALLPDLIDKPIGRILFAESVASGYLVGHSLVFVIVIFIVGYALYRQRGNSHIIQVAGASFLHLVEDQMWNRPDRVLWPAL
ncbi:MAG: metal-dependent hydrolase, partial [Desulfobacteraceae bacterium]|nr:metal-dependent hydrolase [Desulfobacteraceae bacterium]